MRGLSRHRGGKDEHVYRCTCGAWAYLGVPCGTCGLLRGDPDEVCRTAS